MAGMLACDANCALDRSACVPFPEPDAGLEDNKKVAYKGTEVDAAVSFKEEGQLPAVKLVLGTDDFHGKFSLLGFGAAHF